jgi:hypothetical protein
MKYAVNIYCKQIAVAVNSGYKKCIFLDPPQCKVDSLFFGLLSFAKNLGELAFDVDRGVVAERKTPSGERLEPSVHKV